MIPLLVPIGLGLIGGYLSQEPNKYHLGGEMSLHLAPNGKPSNLTHEQWHLVRTPEFKAWFGDWEKDPENASKVVDDNGEPLVVYHGSDKMNDIKIFKSNKGFDYNFFSSSISESERYVVDYERIYPNEKYNTEKRKAYYDSVIKKLFINARKPFHYNKLTITEKQKVINFLKDNEDFLINVISKRATEDLGYESIESYAIDVIGHDYIKTISLDLLIYFLERSSDDWWILETDAFQKYIKENKYDAFVTAESGNFNIAVYNPQNIKLADGSNTTFDSENPDIRYAKGGIIDRKIYQTIINLKNYYTDEYGIEACDINSGECYNFAERLETELSNMGYETEILTNDLFKEIAPPDVLETESVWYNLKDYNSPMPLKYKKPEYFYHAWVYVNGKHYDSDCPEGVKNLFNLPIFKRFIK